MTQTRFQYDYGDPKDAKRNAKRHKPSEQWAWVVQNPKTRRYVVLFGEQECDGPTRVKPLYTIEPDPPVTHDCHHSAEDQMSALYEMIRDGVLVLAIGNDGRTVSEDCIELFCEEWINNKTLDGLEWD